MPVSLRLPLIGLLLLTICHPGVCQDIAASVDVTAARAMSAPEEPSALALSFYGRYLVAGLRDGRLWLWDTASSEEPRVIRAHASRINAAVAGEGKTIAITAKATPIVGNYADIQEQHYIKRVDRETGEQSVFSDSFRSVPRNPNASIALSAEGRMLAATGRHRDRRPASGFGT